MKPKPPGFLTTMVSLVNRQRLKVAVSREEKWLPTLLRVIASRYIIISPQLKVKDAFGGYIVTTG